MVQTTQCIYLTLTAVLIILIMSGCSTSTVKPKPTLSLMTVASPTSLSATVAVSPAATDSKVTEKDQITGVEELDRIIRIVLDGDIKALRSSVRYTQTRCTFEDGLGGPPKCQEGEAEGELVEVLPFLGPEGHFIRKEDIDSWEGIDASDLYAVYKVSDFAFAEPIYPSGEHAIAFINEARFMTTTMKIVAGHIVRVDTNMGNPRKIQPDDVDKYLIAPIELDQ